MPASLSSGRRMSFQYSYWALTSSRGACRGCSSSALVGAMPVRAGSGPPELLGGGARWRRGSRRTRRGWCRKCTGSFSRSSSGTLRVLRLGQHAEVELQLGQLAVEVERRERAGRGWAGCRRRHGRVGFRLVGGWSRAGRGVSVSLRRQMLGHGDRAFADPRGRRTRRRRCCRLPTSLSISSRRLVQAQHVLDDRQAQAGAAGLSRERLVETR